MYRITITGEVKDAEFTLDEEKREFKRIMCVTKDATLKGDIVKAHIEDLDRNMRISENWVVLWGKPWEIVDAMRDRICMAKLRTNELFDYMDQDTITADDEIMLTYPAFKHSDVIRRSRIYKALRSCYVPILSSMYELPRAVIKVFPEDE